METVNKPRPRRRRSKVVDVQPEEVKVEEPKQAPPAQSYLYVAYTSDDEHKFILLPDTIEPIETRHMLDLLRILKRQEGGEANVVALTWKRLIGPAPTNP